MCVCVCLCVYVCVCVFVGGDRGEREGKGGERKVTKHKHNKTRGYECKVS